MDFFLHLIKSFKRSFFNKKKKLYRVFPDILSLKKTASRPDLIELSMAIWSGFLSRFSECYMKCAQEPSCLSLLYNRAFQSCHIFNIIYDSDGNGSIDYYWVLDNRSSRWGICIMIYLHLLPSISYRNL